MQFIFLVNTRSFKSSLNYILINISAINWIKNEANLKPPFDVRDGLKINNIEVNTVAKSLLKQLTKKKLVSFNVVTTLFFIIF